MTAFAAPRTAVRTRLARTRTRPEPTRDLVTQAGRLVLALAIAGNVLNLVAIAWNAWDFPLGGVWATVVYEQNPWTWLSSSLLLVGALLLAVLAQVLPERRWWLLLAGGVALMSLDEIAQLHDRVNHIPALQGVYAMGWVIPAAVGVAIVGWSLRGFLLRMEPGLRRSLVIAAAVYLAGAMGVEAIAGIYETSRGEDRVFHLISSVEENLELIGAFLLVRTLIDQARRRGVTIDLAAGRVTDAASR